MSDSHTIPTLPDFTLVPASAGAGKTHALTRRYLRLIMSEGLPHNGLRNILAVTFTKNAAKEMKERILETLKRAALGEPNALRELRHVSAAGEEEIRNLALMYVERILDDYSDFQIQTIDSFITRVLKASAMELGLPPQFDVEVDTDSVLDDAFDLFARELAVDPAKQELLVRIVDLLSEQRAADARYLWNPLDRIFKELRTLYRELSVHTGEPSAETAVPQFRRLRQEIFTRLQQVGKLVKQPGLTVSKRYADILELARAGNIDAVLAKKLSQPVFNKPKGEYDEGAAEQIGKLQDEVVELAGEYVALQSRTHEAPYVQAYRMTRHEIELAKRRREAVFLGEANRALARMMSADIVPEIYFSLGEQIHHFLIDEFQDTSPIQWAVLRPLIEHSLGGRGSLFIVGDTKQSIYTFRGANWRIMRAMMERDEFASVNSRTLPLTTNYRSAEALVEFTKEVFHSRVPASIPLEISDSSGLASYEQKVRDEARGTGYVEVRVMEASTKHDEHDAQSDRVPEREQMIRILRDCRERGYGFGDMAILTPRNSDVVEVSRWLNAEGIKFLSHSSLDIRTRKTAGELIALLRFLDSPVDNGAFTTFILGELFGKVLRSEQAGADVHEFIHDAHGRRTRDVSLYSVFRDRYPNLWEKYFERLFTLVGYLPLYDLVAEVYRVLDVFTVSAEEEATLVKLLEVVKEFEDNGNNSLKDFLSYADEEGEGASDAWDIATAKSEDAVHVMTVHKAKGLGFPVLVTLFYDRAPRTMNRFIVGEGENVQVLHVTKEWAEKSPEVRERYQEAFHLTQVDDLNKLYVALTRAREEMYVLCVKKRRGDQPSVFLPEDGYTRGTRSRKERQVPSSYREAAVLHIPAKSLPVAATVDPVRLRETRRGELIHNVLSEIVSVDEHIQTTVGAAIEKRKGELRNDFKAGDISATILEFIHTPAVAEYFASRQGRVVLNEQEIVDASGALHRIDRLVVDPTAATVLDYKTGDDRETYDKQVREYMEIVRTMYPEKTVKGFLLFVDRRTVREVA